MNFNTYALYYDLLYKDKNYYKEALFIDTLIKRHHPAAITVLDLGCGTGKHAMELLNLGYDVIGIDRSQQMIDLAKRYTKKETIFFQGDLTDIRLEKNFDVVVSLFDVMSYQITNEDVNNAFRTAFEHLQPGGVFIFDSWYGPGVLNDPPAETIKKIENDKLEIERKAFPTIGTDKNIVHVHYHVAVKDKRDGKDFFIEEEHPMRYFFLDEIQDFAGKHNLHLVHTYQWFIENEDINDNCWKAIYVLQK